MSEADSSPAEPLPYLSASEYPKRTKKPFPLWILGIVTGLLFFLPMIIMMGFGLLTYFRVNASGTSYAQPSELAYDIFPDGKRVIFSQPGPLSVLDLTTKNITALNSKGIPSSVAYPALSPKGDTVAFSAWSDLWIASLDGKTVRQLTHDTTYSEFAPHFSPDGKQLVFARPRNNPTSPTGVLWIDYDIWTIQRDGTNLRQITQGKYYGVSGAQFTPDGKTIVFAAEVPTNNLGEQREALFEVDAQGAQPPSEIFGGNANSPGGCYVSNPALSPDGKQFTILSDSTQPYLYDLGWLRRDGSGFHPLGIVTQNGQNNPCQFRYSPDGKQIFYLWGNQLWKTTSNGNKRYMVAQL